MSEEILNKYKSDFMEVISFKDNDEQVYRIETEDKCSLVLNNIELEQLSKLLVQVVEKEIRVEKQVLYKVCDDEWETVMGKGQLCNLAKQRIIESGFFDEEDLSDIIRVEEFGTKLAPKMIEVVRDVQENLTDITDVEIAKGILNADGYEVEEIEVY